MSSCDTCNCSDKNQCPKKGNSYGIDIVETGKSYLGTAVMDVAGATEHNGQCKCGPSCSCMNCTCSH